MSKFIVLFSQSYVSRLKSKSFMITTLLFLAALCAAFLWPTISGWLSSNEGTVRIAIVDHTDMQASSFFNSDDRLKFKRFTGSLQEADEAVKSKKTDGVLLLEQTASGQLTAQIRTADHALRLNDQQSLEQHVQAANQRFTIQEMKLSAAQAERLLRTHVALDQQTLSSNTEGKSAQSKMQATLISYAFAFLIYLFVLSYLSMISSEVAAEKDSRIMEMVISSSSPVVHLLARVSGILALELTQLLVFAGTALLMACSFDGGKYWRAISSAFAAVSPAYIIFALLFFILACVLYTLLGAVLGSLVNKVQDVGQSVMPVTFVLMIGFFVAVSGLNNPDTLLIKIFSYIPFTASMIMPMRIGATEMGLWEAVLSLLLLAGTIVGLFFASLRFYKGSVLTYTSGSFLKKLKQAIQLSR